MHAWQCKQLKAEAQSVVSDTFGAQEDRDRGERLSGSAIRRIVRRICQRDSIRRNLSGRGKCHSSSSLVHM